MIDLVIFIAFVGGVLLGGIIMSTFRRVEHKPQLDRSSVLSIVQAAQEIGSDPNNFVDQIMMMEPGKPIKLPVRECNWPEGKAGGDWKCEIRATHKVMLQSRLRITNPSTWYLCPQHYQYCKNNHVIISDLDLIRNEVLV